MTKPPLSIVSNEVEVELDQSDDPRLAGWRQNTRLWCRADHRIIIESVVEGRAGGVIDEEHYLRVGIATQLGSQQPVPFPHPLYFRRQDDTGRSSLAWFDQAEFGKSGATNLIELLRHIEALQRTSGPGAVDLLVLARLGLARMLAEIPDGPHGTPERDIKTVADRAYQLGYLAALDDVKARGIDALARRGVTANDSLDAAKEGRIKTAREANLPLTDLARKLAATDRNMSLNDCARKIALHIQITPGLEKFARRDESDIRKAIKAAAPPIFERTGNQYRPVAGATDVRPAPTAE